MLGHLEPELERARHRDPGEVLLEMAHDVDIVAARREDVDEAEERGLEPGLGHGPREHPLAPPAEMEDPRRLGRARLGDPAGERLHVAFVRGSEHLASLPRQAPGRNPVPPGR